MLNFLRNAKIKYKLFILLGVSVIGFLAIGIYAQKTVGDVKVNGPIYRDMIKDKDLMSDFKMPSENLAEPYLIVLQTMNTQDKQVVEKNIIKIQGLRKVYTERFNYWKSDLEDSEVKNLIINDANVSAETFFSVIEKDFIPAALAGDKKKMSEVVEGPLKESYDSSKRTIERIISLAVEKNASNELSSSIAVTKKTIMMFAITGIALIVTVIISFLIIALIVKPIKHIVDIMSDIAAGEGDLTKQLDIDTSDEIGEFAGWFNIFIEKLHDIISRVSIAAVQIASATQQLAATAEEMASGSEQQTSQISQVATSMEEMSATVQEVAKNSSVAAEKAKGAGDTAAEGGKVVDQTVSKISSISSAVRQLQDVIKALSSNSEKIGNIVKVIDDVADQTNLLALNAAIEAARAGEQGRGFAVVADEVRKLAERTTTSTKEIAGMVKSIQEDTSKAVTSMDSSSTEVDEGVIYGISAGNSLSEIVTAAKSAQEMIQQIATATEEQSAATQEISSNVESMASVSKQNAQAAQQAAQASQEISRLTDELHQMVSRFKLRQEANVAVKNTAEGMMNNFEIK